MGETKWPLCEDEPIFVFFCRFAVFGDEKFFVDGVLDFGQREQFVLVKSDERVDEGEDYAACDHESHPQKLSIF